MLYFTGWGLSTEGKLKPDVTLPGGMIYSAIPNGSYDMDGGTSMATPHVAGATALIKQALEERFPQYSPEQFIPCFVNWLWVQLNLTRTRKVIPILQSATVLV